MRVLRAALLAAVLLGGVTGAPCPAPAVAAEATAETRELARAFLDKLNVQTMVDQLIGASRAGVLVMFRQMGKTDQQAGEIFDQFLLPEFKARSPELMERFEDVLATTFTAAELRSVLEDRQDEARRSAIAKVPAMQAAFGRAGQEWGQKVGQDAYNKNKAALQKLGLD